MKVYKYTTRQKRKRLYEIFKDASERTGKIIPVCNMCDTEKYYRLLENPTDGEAVRQITDILYENFTFFELRISFSEGDALGLGGMQ